MKYFEKRPTVEAIRFTGTNTVKDIKRLCIAYRIRYEETLGGQQLYAEMSNLRSIIVQRGDYVVREGESIKVMSEEEFEAKYELASPCYSVKVNQDGYVGMET